MRPARSLFVVQSFNALVVIGTAPFAHRYGAHLQSLGNHPMGFFFSSGQNNLRTLHQPVGQWARMGDGQQFIFSSSFKLMGIAGRLPPDMSVLP